MRNAKRTQSRKQSGDWGVVEARSTHNFGHAAPVWLAYWMDLAPDGQVSIELDADRDANITSAAWGRARRAFGLPQRILVLDDDTAARVRRAVPPKVIVVVSRDHPGLKAMATSLVFPDDDLDLVPFPAPRARC